MAHLQETMKGIENREAAAGTDVGTVAEAGSLADVVAAIGTGESVDQPPERLPDVWGPYDPDVGDTIIYQPRRGDIRRGRKRVAAIVTHRYPEARLFDLAVIFEASDVLDQQRVPEAVGEERGWIIKGRGSVVANGSLGLVEAFAEAASRSSDRIIADTAGPDPLTVDVAGLKAGFEELRQIVLGSFDVPDHSVLDMINDIDGRVDALAARVGSGKIIAEPERPKGKKAAPKPAKKAKRGR